MVFSELLTVGAVVREGGCADDTVSDIAAVKYMAARIFSARLEYRIS